MAMLEARRPTSAGRPAVAGSTIVQLAVTSDEASAAPRASSTACQAVLDRVIAACPGPIRVVAWTRLHNSLPGRGSATIALPLRLAHSEGRGESARGILPN